MRWTIDCVGCGTKMQVSDAQLGRHLQCPSCRQGVTAKAPRQVDPAPSATQPAPRRLGRWVVGALASPVVLASAAGVAWMNWPDEDTGPRGTISQPYTTPPRPARSGPMLIEATPPVVDRGIEAMINASLALEVRLTGRETGKPLDLVGKVSANLAAAVDPKTGSLLAATHDGRLAWFDPKECKPVGDCRLERPAYHMVVDGTRRLLYAASSAGPLELGQLGDRDRGPGDIHVYDLELILKGGGDAKPARRLNLDAHVTGMILSAGGDELYFSAETTHDVQIGRVNTKTWQRDRNRWMRISPPTALALAVEGPPVLHALAGGRLLLLDPATWKVLDSVAVGGSVTGVQPGKGGQVYLLERRHSSQVQVVDLPKRMLLARWTLETDGRPYMHLSPDARRLYVSTSAVATGRIWSIDLSSDLRGELRFTGHATSDKTRLLRGGLHMLGREPYLVTGSGFVYRGS